MKRDNKDFKLTDEARYMLAKQRVNVPVTVLDRTIVDAELMLDGTGLEASVMNRVEKAAGGKSV